MNIQFVEIKSNYLRLIRDGKVLLSEYEYILSSGTEKGSGGINADYEPEVVVQYDRLSRYHTWALRNDFIVRKYILSTTT